MKSALRWNCTITYRTDKGPLDVDHSFMELFELHNIVERGPNFTAIERVVITYAFDINNKTIEQAETE